MITDLGSSSEPTGGEDPVAKLTRVREVLAAFDWECDDRQYALEEIDRIVSGDDD